MSSGDNRRIEWIDAAKGIGIILVVLGHMTIPRLAKLFIYSFHMPLFFFISGYLHKRNFSVKWCARKVDALIVPYWMYGVIIMCAMSAIGRWGWMEMIERMVKGIGVDPLWFLVCLFFSETIGAMIVRNVDKSLLAIILLMGTLGVVLPQCTNFGWFKLRTLPAALTFWLAGFAMNRHSLFDYFRIEARLYRKMGVLACLVVMSSLFFLQRIDMNSARYGNALLFYGTALSSSILLCLGLRRLESIRFPAVIPCLHLLSWFGRVSLIIMCLHPTIPQICAEFIRTKFVQRIVSLMVLLAAAWVIDRKIPLLTGRVMIFSKIIDRNES